MIVFDKGKLQLLQMFYRAFPDIEHYLGLEPAVYVGRKKSYEYTGKQYQTRKQQASDQIVLPSVDSSSDRAVDKLRAGEIDQCYAG
jgi:hypothetical protein